MLFSLNPLRSQTISWSVLNNELKDELLTFLQTCPLPDKDSIYVHEFNPNDSITITVFAERGTAVRFEEVRLLGKSIRSSCLASMPGWLADSLLHRNYAWIAAGGMSAASRRMLGQVQTASDAAMLTWARNAEWSAPTSFEIALPSRVVVRLGGTDMTVFASLGNDELGMPGPALSTLRAGAGWKSIKVFATLPVVTAAEKRLEGALGAGLEWSAGPVGGQIQVGEVAKFDRFNSSLEGSRNRYSVMQQSALLFYQGEQLIAGSSVVRYRAGLAAYGIITGQSLDGERFLIESRRLYGGAYFRIDWLAVWDRGAYPELELTARSIIGNRSSVTGGFTWNFNRSLGMQILATFTPSTDETDEWTTVIAPWGSLIVRL
jgi:hypothetical protein